MSPAISERDIENNVRTNSRNPPVASGNHEHCKNPPKRRQNSDFRAPTVTTGQPLNQAS